MASVCRQRPWLRPGLTVSLAFALTSAAGAAAQAGPASPQVEAPASSESGPYVRLGAGLDWPEATTVQDANCSSQNPPALFGCRTGNNGQPLGATGSFDPALVVDGALGYRFNRWIRAEALLSWRPDLDFSGQSNFLGAAGPNQQVSGAVSSVAGFGVAYVDLPRIGKVRPFLGAGLGVARNRIESLHFQFPGISATASTTTPGGSSSDLAYLLTAGISVPLRDRLDLDLAYRFSDLGSVGTGSGQAQVVRPAGSFIIPIAGTSADLQTHGVMVSLRYAF
jgi:opacity protein-like surface antigen